MASTISEPSTGSAASASAVSTTHTVTTTSLSVAIAIEENGSGSGGTLSDNQAGTSGSWTKIGSVSSGIYTVSAFYRNNAIVPGSVTFTYTGSLGATACAFVTHSVGGGVSNPAELIRQFHTNTGAGGTAPSVTFATPTQADQVLVIVGYGDPDSGTAATVPSGYTLGTSESAPGCRVTTATNVSAAAGTTTVTWASASTGAWAALMIEINAAALGELVSSSQNWQASLPGYGSWNYQFVSGSGPNAQYKSDSVMILTKLGAAVTVPYRLRSKITNGDWEGSSVANVRVTGMPPGGSFGAITPSSNSYEGNGFGEMVIPGSYITALGAMPLRIFAPDVSGQVGSQVNTDVTLIVVAFDPQDAVHMGLSALPNQSPSVSGGLPIQGDAVPDASAGAVGGLPTITAVGQGPGGVLKPNSMTDNYVYTTINSVQCAVNWRLRIFTDAAALGLATPGNPNNADSEIERYEAAASYNSDGTLAYLGWAKQL